MRQDARENRERILAAAEEVFGEYGAAGSTEEVARRAGVGVATVFRHFPTKDALVEAALLRHFDHLTAQAQNLAGAGDPEQALRTLLTTMIETGATKLTLASLLSAGSGFTPDAQTAAERLKVEVDEVLHRAQRAGAVRPSVGIDEVYLLIRALAQASATMRTSPDVLARAVDVVLAGIAHRPD